jgi:hypothetical protein
MARTTRSAPSALATRGTEPRLPIVSTEPGVYGYESWKNMTIGVWVGQATLQAVRGVHALSREMELQYPEGRSSIVFVADQVAAPTPEARQEMVAVYERPGLQCTAIILEGSGFWASGIRSMTSNLHRAAGSSMRLRVHTTIDEVIAWMPAEHQRCTGVALDCEELKRVVIEIRQRAGARAAGLPTPG